MASIVKIVTKTLEPAVVKIAGIVGPTGATGPQGPAGPALNPVAVRWSPTFQATGMTFTGTGTTYPTYNSYYIKVGQLVSFWIQIDFTTVTNFGTGQFKVDMPFPALASASNHFFGWLWANPALPPDDLNGHIQIAADHISGSSQLDFHWLQATTSNPKPIIESILSQGNPITLTTVSRLYVNGTYIAAS